jgi:hypothetical protein
MNREAAGNSMTGIGNGPERFGERAGVRTLDLLIKSQLLYQLSYALPRIGESPLRRRTVHTDAFEDGQPGFDRLALKKRGNSPPHNLVISTARTYVLRHARARRVRQTVCGII